METIVRKSFLILLMASITQGSFAQSIEIKPNQTFTSNRKGPNLLSIHSRIFDENSSNDVTSGNSKIILSGEIGATNGSYFDYGSTQSIEFNHVNTKRWILGDFFYNNSFAPDDTLNAFQIRNENVFFYAVPFHINKNNNFIGLNTDKPLTKLHLKASGSNVTPFANTTFFIENNNHNYLHMGAADGFDNGILFSNTVHNPSFGGSIQYKADNRMLFQTNGQTRLLLNASGRVGINTLSPSARLHVFNGNSGVSGTPADEFIIENNANNYIQMMNPQANEAGLLFGLPSSLVSGGIIYNNGGNGALQFRTNNNQTQMTVDNTGNVGIGSTSPAAKLDVNGTVKIGTHGTVLTEVIKHTHGPVSFTVNTNTSASYSITIPNVEPGSSIVATTSKPLPLGIIQYAHCTTAGIVEIVFFNARNSTSTLTLNDFQIYITVIR